MESLVILGLILRRCLPDYPLISGVSTLDRMGGGGLSTTFPKPAQTPSMLPEPTLLHLVCLGSMPPTQWLMFCYSCQHVCLPMESTDCLNGGDYTCYYFYIFSAVIIFIYLVPRIVSCIFSSFPFFLLALSLVLTLRLILVCSLISQKPPMEGVGWRRKVVWVVKNTAEDNVCMAGPCPRCYGSQQKLRPGVGSLPGRGDYNESYRLRKRSWVGRMGKDYSK